MASIKPTKVDTPQFERRVILSHLWIFLLATLFWSDFHTLITPGEIQKVIDGMPGGVEVNEGFLLIAAIIHMFPTAMMLFSRFLKRGVNRWVNIIFGAIQVFFFVSDGYTDMDHIFFRIILTITAALIIYFAWTWPKNEV